MSSDKPDKEPKPKKGGGMMKIALIGVGMLAIGGGGAFGVMAFTGGGHHAEKEDNKPRLIRKGEEDPFAVKAEGDKEGEGGAAEIDGDGGSEYRTAYYSFSDEFTSNLKDSEALVQVALACSTRRDGRVLMWIKKHELAIRSRMLEVLADTPEQDVGTIEGKDRLRKRLTAAINRVLTDTEGFGGVDAVYFKNFIIQ
jgi:flagellar FliL protein